MPSHPCDVCGQPAARQCSRCKRARYCGTDCQRQHWKHGGHKHECRPPSPEQAVGSSTVPVREGPAAVGAVVSQPTVVSSTRSETRPQGTEMKSGDLRQTAKQMLDEHRLFGLREEQQLLLPLAAHVASPQTGRWLLHSVVRSAIAPSCRCGECYPEFYSALTLMMPYATTSTAVTFIIDFLDDVFQETPKQICDTVFATEALRDGIVQMAQYVETADAAASVTQLICRITDGATQAPKTLFATVAVRDMLIRLAAYSTTTEASNLLCFAIREIVNGDDVGARFAGPGSALQRTIDANIALFATAKMRDALVALAAHAKTSAAVEWMSVAVSYLARGSAEANKDVFATETVRDALVGFARYATTATAVEWWAEAIVRIVGDSNPSPSRCRLFATVMMRDAIVAVATHATMPEAAKWLATLVVFIGHGSPLFVTAEMRTAVIALKAHAWTPDAAQMVSLAIRIVSATAAKQKPVRES